MIASMLTLKNQPYLKPKTYIKRKHTVYFRVLVINIEITVPIFFTFTTVELETVKVRCCGTEFSKTLF